MNFFNYSSPIITVYLYLLVFFTFFLFYQDIAKNNQLPLLADLHNRSTDKFRKITFIIILLTFLGTPVTLGFIYKLLVLSNLTTMTVIVAIIINLIMLVFYLQAARHPQLSRKKRQVFTSQDINLRSKVLIIFFILLSLSALIYTPLLVDIISLFL